MTDQRSSLRPVTLPRLFEVVDTAVKSSTPSDIVSRLDVSKRRANEVVEAATRIGLLTEQDCSHLDEYKYCTTTDGQGLLRAIRREDWKEVSRILREGSPHYHRFLSVVHDVGPASRETLLTALQARSEENWLTFNETGLDVLCDWGERLGSVQRNSYSGDYYPVSDSVQSSRIVVAVEEVYDELNETVGVAMSRRSIPIPEFREQLCEKLRCSRVEAEEILVELNRANATVELQGAPMDTVAKEAPYGTKSIELDERDGLITANQTTEHILTGLRLAGREYYYIAIHGSTSNLDYPQDDD